MTKLLARAFEEASELPSRLQDELGREILEGLIGESKWDETLARTQDQLEELGDEALAELRASRTVAGSCDHSHRSSRLRPSNPGCPGTGGP